MADLVKENYCVISKLVYNSRLVAFLISCQGVSINCPYFYPCGPGVDKQG
jgi:hypothetical protein